MVRKAIVAVVLAVVSMVPMTGAAHAAPEQCFEVLGLRQCL